MDSASIPRRSSPQFGKLPIYAQFTLTTSSKNNLNCRKLLAFVLTMSKNIYEHFLANQ